jgi:arylsulfatase
MTDKPNLLLITTDTQRCDTLNCMGYPHAISPNLDRLASEGVMFTQAHTSAPVCFPARSCLITGLHTPIHGAIENGTTRLSHFPTLPDLLKAEGYRNLMIGKSHFSPIPDTFDAVIEKEYDNYLVERGYDPDDLKVHPTPIPEEHFRETWVVDQTIEQIEQSVSDEVPFFAFCSMKAPHPPETPPGDWMSCYEGVSLPELNYTPGEEQTQPAHTKRLLGIEKTNTCLDGEDPKDVAYWREAIGRIYDPEHHETIQEVRRLYYAYAAYCDAQIGRLIDYLDKKGIRNNTLVIFTSDHGQQYFDHGFNDKHNWYDESWRIPLVMSMPGTLPSGEERAFAIWNDITTTLLGAAGTSCQTMQGFDLFTPLAAGEASPRKCAVGSVYKSCALATQRWKLEYYMEEGDGRLFDRVEDPREQSDRYDDPAYADVRNAMLHALLTWRSDLVDLHGLIEGTTAKPKPMDQRKDSRSRYLLVAPRISLHTRAMKGTDSEQRLNDRAERIDARD